MSHLIYRIKRKLTEAVDKYIWGAIFLIVYFGTIVAVIAILYSF